MTRRPISTRTAPARRLTRVLLALAGLAVVGPVLSAVLSVSAVLGVPVLSAVVGVPGAPGASLSPAPLSPTPLLAQQPAPPADAAFVASSRGRVYYPVSCSAWRGLSPKNLLFFESAEEAQARGYRLTRNRSCRAPASLDALGPLSALEELDALGALDTFDTFDTLDTLGSPGPLGSPDPHATDARHRAVQQALGLPEWAGPTGRVVGTCTVTRIVDGDTVDCRDDVRIRLLLVDAPETAQSDYGLRARLALEELLPVGSTAAVEVDVQPRDRYGRLLAHLHVDGTWVNRALVRRGYAVPLVYPPNVLRVEAVRAAADSARTERRGLWEIGAFECLPVDYRAGRCGG